MGGKGSGPRPQEHTHLRVDLVSGVEAGILQERNICQPPGPSSPAHPRAPLDSMHSPLSHHLGQKGRSSLPTVVPPITPNSKPSTMLLSSVKPRSVICNRFLFVNVIVIKTVDIYGALAVARPYSKVGRALFLLSCSFYRGGD